MSYSWFLDPVVPYNSKTFPTQSTYFGSSSLASSSASMLAIDNGKQEPSLYKMTGGNRHTNNLTVIDQDKSPLGVSVRERASRLRFTKVSDKMVTVPNTHSLSRNTLL